MSTATPPTYQLICHGCEWHVLAPKRFDLARVLAWSHQKQVAFNQRHAVEFAPVLASSPNDSVKGSH